MLRCLIYTPVSVNVSTREIRGNLPASLLSELIQTPAMFQHMVAVDAEKVSVVHQLDELLLNSSGPAMVKTLQVESTRKELAEFPYYYIQPQRLDIGKDVFGEISTPNCGNCSNGSTLFGIRLHDKWFGKLEFGEIFRTHRLDNEFILSVALRDAFDEAGISGLEYEDFGQSGFLVARPRSKTTRRASEVLSRLTCDKHKVAVAPLLADPCIDFDNLTDDFVQIDSFTTPAMTCRLSPPAWIVSRHAVEFLLSKKVKLGTVTLRSKASFMPCLA